MQSMSDAQGHTPAKRIRIETGVALKSFSDVIPIEAIAEINEAIDRSFGSLAQRAQLSLMAAELIRRSESFRQLEENMCTSTRAMAAKAGQTELPLQPFHVIRCSSAATVAESHCRHYDSHLLTLLIPLQLAPEGDANGDLVMYRRPRLSVSTPGNVICKIRHGIQRGLPLGWRKWLTQHDLRRGNCDRVPVQIGSVYVFNGFALQHANLEVETGQRRTLLIHYYDPGHSLGLSEVLRRRRH
ncbi:hypothetical protein [Paraburkholderia ginsengisoli]|jgi:hypothetical protein|uniref:Fe2OG dioxygenase domain-containing protein n=2 Tax=Paraburkholderia ginsengisoli TaxID=311231 RepID=A0A7T4T734_9BURK|nr:hypothetical protein [Paraburkholderia ginsengisoli]QQC62417.1 hypothetical protein I6I06_08675 [Paraburkholderia ginsengisoli]